MRDTCNCSAGNFKKSARTLERFVEWDSAQIIGLPEFNLFLEIARYLPSADEETPHGNNTWNEHVEMSKVKLPSSSISAPPEIGRENTSSGYPELATGSCACHALSMPLYFSPWRILCICRF